MKKQVEKITEHELAYWQHEGLPPAVAIVGTPWGGALMTVVCEDVNWSAS